MKSGVIGFLGVALAIGLAVGQLSRLSAQDDSTPMSTAGSHEEAPRGNGDSFRSEPSLDAQSGASSGDNVRRGDETPKESPVPPGQGSTVKGSTVNGSRQLLIVMVIVGIVVLVVIIVVLIAWWLLLVKVLDRHRNQVATILDDMAQAIAGQIKTEIGAAVAKPGTGSISKHELERLAQPQIKAVAEVDEKLLQLTAIITRLESSVSNTGIARENVGKILAAVSQAQAKSEALKHDFDRIDTGSIVAYVDRLEKASAEIKRYRTDVENLWHRAHDADRERHEDAVRQIEKEKTDALCQRDKALEQARQAQADLEQARSQSNDRRQQIEEKQKQMDAMDRARQQAIDECKSLQDSIERIRASTLPKFMYDLAMHAEIQRLEDWCQREMPAALTLKATLALLAATHADEMSDTFWLCLRNIGCLLCDCMVAEHKSPTDIRACMNAWKQSMEKTAAGRFTLNLPQIGAPTTATMDFKPGVTHVKLVRSWGVHSQKGVVYKAEVE